MTPNRITLSTGGTETVNSEPSNCSHSTCSASRKTVVLVALSIGCALIVPSLAIGAPGKVLTDYRADSLEIRQSQLSHQSSLAQSRLHIIAAHEVNDDGHLVQEPTSPTEDTDGGVKRPTDTPEGTDRTMLTSNRFGYVLAALGLALSIVGGYVVFWVSRRSWD